jgi:hypothetical protein
MRFVLGRHPKTIGSGRRVEWRIHLLILLRRGHSMPVA